MQLNIHAEKFHLRCMRNALNRLRICAQFRLSDLRFLRFRSPCVRFDRIKAACRRIPDADAMCCLQFGL